MKTRMLSILVLANSLQAQEPNPFVEKRSDESPVASAGDPYVNVIEHILVPARLVDPWIEQHPIKGDATALRDAAQQWITQGEAILEQTSVSSGTAGTASANESGIEQTYVTEFDPPEPGAWPFPVAFETRQLGYSNASAAGLEGGTMSLFATLEFIRMVPLQEAWYPLADKTREPTDVFIPRFEVMALRRSVEAVRGADPFAADNPFAKPPSDPFAGVGALPAVLGSGLPKGVPFTPGRIHLASRTMERVPTNEKIPESAAPSSVPDTTPDNRETTPGRKLRLIFFRGAFAPNPPFAKAPPTQDFNLAFKLIRVDQRAFSDWIQKSELATLPASAWAVASEWQKDGRAEVVTDLAGSTRAGAKVTLEDAIEVSYPTGWNAGQRRAEADGKPGPVEFSSPANFETRNVGNTFEARLEEDQQGLMLRYLLSRVIQGDRTVHHRIHRDGKWQADIAFPRWSVSEWNSTLRVTRGQWTLVGTGANFDTKGNFDTSRILLAFVKVE